MVQQARDVDHIIPVKGPDDPIFWDEGNWQPLCSTHHKQKTARQNSQRNKEPVSIQKKNRPFFIRQVLPLWLLDTTKIDVEIHRRQGSALNQVFSDETRASML